jgi:NADPH-dependent glutamate synthase beta subunit-like oxidoreductase
MKKFKHLNAASLEEAASVLGEYGKKARVIAGGTDLLGEMQDAILPEYPEVVVNIKSIPGLDYIREENGKLRIGALTRLEDITTSGLVNEKFPVLAEACSRTASPHIREMGTIAGNICQSNRCWYYWVPDNRFNCLRKGGATCFAVNGDARYHSIFGGTRVGRTPCSAECPANVDIPDYLAKLREGDIAGAARILLEANPLPAITGRVCPHSCETKCNRVGYDETVSIKYIERYLGDYILDQPDMLKPESPGTGKKVAIAGSGPAGLAAAYYLNRAGHEVTIFEKRVKAGGLLTYGIPPYRLPRDVVEKQIQALFDAGVRFNTGASVDVDGLAKEFDAVLLACGAGKERHAGIPGEQYLASGMEFLRDTGTGKRNVPGKKVAVIGGGNVAVDVARTLLRLGAEPVVLYRRGREEMPALGEEVEKAVEEGIAMQFLTLPVRAENKDGGISLTCTKMKLGAPDASGRPRPEPVPGSEFITEYDAVMEALGEEPDLAVVPQEYLAEGKLRLDESCRVGGNIFAGGDFASGPATVVQAIAGGRQAAAGIYRYLGGQASEPSGGRGREMPRKFAGECLGKTARAKAPEVPAPERVKSLDAEDVGGLDRSAVDAEAARCFNCGCVAVNPSDLAPALVASGADIRTNRRVIPAEDFFTVAGDRTTVLESDEIVTEIIVPAIAPGTKGKFLKSAIRKSIDFPLVNCAAVIACEKGVVKSARICLNSVYTQPYRVASAESYLSGKPIDENSAAAAADLITAEALPLLNNRYKIQIARALLKRVILACG